MNNKGQVVIFTLMLSIVIIILALAFAPVLKQSVEDARNPDSLDCSNTSISNFDKLGCLSTDASLFGFIGIAIFLAGSIIGARVIFNG